MLFPQLGAPVGLYLSSGFFWVLMHLMSQNDLLAWGWRLPFLASDILIVLGLWVRLSITETPEFAEAVRRDRRVSVPVVELSCNHKRSLVLGSFVALVTFVLFYVCSAWLLSYDVKVRQIAFMDALPMQIYGSVIVGLTLPLAGKVVEAVGRRSFLVVVTVLIGVFLFFLAPLMGGSDAALYGFVPFGMFLMGLTYGVIGAALAAPFPTRMR